MATGWFPRFSPDGAYLATGSINIVVGPVGGTPLARTGTVALGLGMRPSWPTATRVLFYNRQDASAARICYGDAPGFARHNLSEDQRAFTLLDSGGGLWAGYNAVRQDVRIGSATTGALITTLAGRASPTVDANGRYGTTNLALQALFLSTVGTVVSGRTVFEPRIATGGIVWSSLVTPRRTFGWRGGAIEALSAFGTAEFGPLVVDTPAGPWILVWSANTLFLHPWGNTTVLSVHVGDAFYPHAVYAGGRFLVAWTDGAGTLAMRALAVNTADPLYAIGSGTATGGTGSGAAGGVGGPSTVTPTAKALDEAKLAAARAPKRQYPHVTDIADLHAQKSVRLLWDRVFDLAEQLNGTAPSALKDGTAAVAGTLSAFQTSTGQTIQQLQATTTGTPLHAHALPGGGGSGSSGGSGSPGGGQGGGGDGSGDGGIANQLSVVVAARATWDAKVGIERAGRICNQVAWDLQSQGVGLVDKPTGTNYRGLSISVIMLTNGVAYDILGDSEGAANPQWNRIASIDASRWRAPVDPTSF